MGELVHGHDGWTLDDYEWDPLTGIGSFVYEREPGKRVPDRRVAGDRADVERILLQRPQPSNPRHAGWNARDVK